MPGTGMVPRIKPKSNTVRNAKGSQSWREMVDLYMDDREAFDSGYHQCSIIESVFAALKKMYGDCTRCRRPDNQTREISIRITTSSSWPGRRQKTAGSHRTKSQH